MIGEAPDLFWTHDAALSSVPLSPDPRAVTSPPKPLWRGRLHLAWFEISVVTGTLIVAPSKGGVGTGAAAIHAASVTALFGTSALVAGIVAGYGGVLPVGAVATCLAALGFANDSR